MMRMALGDVLRDLFGDTAVMIFALVASRSSRLMPGLRAAGGDDDDVGAGGVS